MENREFLENRAYAAFQSQFPASQRAGRSTESGAEPRPGPVRD
jgi:hypothetical protein